jgi:hypothetical protein
MAGRNHIDTHINLKVDPFVSEEIEPALQGARNNMVYRCGRLSAVVQAVASNSTPSNSYVAIRLKSELADAYPPKPHYGTWDRRTAPTNGAYQNRHRRPGI